MIKKYRPIGRCFYFFLDFDDGFLNSLYSISADVNANSADAAVIKPGIKPLENQANKQIAKIKTIVIPKFFANTFSIFSKVLILFSLSFGWNNYIIKMCKNTQIKNDQDFGRFFIGSKHENFYYKITWPPKRAVLGIGPNDERGET